MYEKKTGCTLPLLKAELKGPSSREVSFLKLSFKFFKDTFLDTCIMPFKNRVLLLAKIRTGLKAIFTVSWSWYLSVSFLSTVQKEKSKLKSLTLIASFVESDTPSILSSATCSYCKKQLHLSI